MTEQPDLEAIRARLAGAQRFGGYGSFLLADALALLSLVARLQGERDSARAALQGLCVVRVDGRSCWCEEEWLLRHAAEGHTDACRAARAALGEE